MAIIRPTGTEIVSGQNREVTDNDDLFVSNINSPGELNIDGGTDLTLNAASGQTVRLGTQAGIPQAIAIGGGFETPNVGDIWIEPSPGIADGQNITLQGAFADDAQGFNGGNVNLTGGTSTDGSVIAGSVNLTGGDASASVSGLGGSVQLTAGQGFDTSADGIISLTGPRGGQWTVATINNNNPSPWLIGEGDSSTGINPVISGSDGGQGSNLTVRGGDGGEGGHLFLIGGQTDSSSHPGDVYVRGGFSSGSFVTGGHVYIDSSSSQAEGGEGGQVLIGTNQGTELPNTYTRRVIVGEEGASTSVNEVLIYNANLGGPSTPTTVSGALSAGDALAEAGLIKVSDGFTSIGDNSVMAGLHFGPVYYDTKNGTYIRMGNSIYIDGSGVNNLIRGGDGDDIENVFPFTAATSGVTYSLASAGVIAASALEPGSVTVRIILEGGFTFSEVTDDGAGTFASGAVLPAGGTVDYAARTLTGTTAGLQITSRVEIAFQIADRSGEELTVRAGDGFGTGNGGALYLASGTGTIPGSLSLRTPAQGSSSVVERYLVNAVSKALVNTTATSIFTATVASNTMIGGSVHLTVRANDATDFQSTSVFFIYAAVNDAGTVTSQVTLNAGNTATIATTGTLTVTASATNGAGIITVQITATSSLTPTTLDATYQVINNAGQSITVV